MALLALSLVTSCISNSTRLPVLSRSGTTSRPLAPSKFVVRVHADARVTHSGRLYTYDFGGERAIATRSDGSTTTTKFDSAGFATLRLEPGRYVVTVSERDVCAPYKLALAEVPKSLELRCALP